MKKILAFLLTSSILLSLSACKSNTDNIINENSSSINQSSESSTNEKITAESTTNETSNGSDQSLTNYSDEQIEYARVWLTLGVHQEIDELNILKIPAGTLINPNDETSSIYPKDTIKLSGSRLVDGSITYSSNENGTITTYEVPTRWEQDTPEDLDKTYMRKFTQSLIDNGSVMSVEVGNPEDVIKLINIQIMR